MARGPRGVQIWDAPTRLFHWALVVLFGTAWISAELRDMETHRIAGSLIAGLLVFRLWWGLFGSSTARFAQFLRGPRAVVTYALSLVSGGKSEPEAGHNPMGGWSVVLLLASLALLVGFGLFAVDVDGFESGPLANLIDFDAGRAASHVHARIFGVVEALVALHLAAILFYRLVRRQDLVTPMITGRHRAAAPETGLRPGSTAMLALGGALAVMVALLLVHLGGD